MERQGSLKSKEKSENISLSKFGIWNSDIGKRNALYVFEEMSSESSVSDDFRPLIQLASDILQDAVALAGTATTGNERVRIRSENIASKLISMISSLSQISIEHANKLKQYRRIERKSMKYIEELRNCVINQGMEIEQLQAQISSQNSAATASCVMKVDSATNTDGPTTEFIVVSMCCTCPCKISIIKCFPCEFHIVLGVNESTF